MSVLEDFLDGRPIQAPVIDAHMHLPPRALFYRMSGISQWYLPGMGTWQQHETFQNLASIVEHMDRVGLTKAMACINGFERLEEGFECVRRFPGRFLPLVSFWPGIGKTDEATTTTPGGRRVPDSPQELREVLERVYARGWRGVKIWDPRAPEPLGWLYEGILGFAHEHRMLVLHHSWGPPAVLDRIAERYPNARLFMGHALESQPALDSYRAVILRRPNVFATTTNTRYPGSLEAMVSTLGDDKLVMGSDFILHTVEFAIGNLAYARISEQSKRKILGLNLKNLLDELGYWGLWGYPGTGMTT
jgi:predicted TIM-barrel fold metal-dependent hydrolase